MSIEKIIITGVTHDGQKFRPSDWAERLYYSLATYGKYRKLIFEPLVSLKQINNYKCVVINPIMEEEKPMTFDFLMDFAKSNRLQVTDQDDNPLDTY